MSSTGSRFVVVTPDDHSAWIWLPTVLALTYSFCFLVFRAAVKWKRIAADDGVLVVAYVFALCHWITEFVALHNGLGKSSHFLTDAQKQKASENTFASRILLLIALCLTKCSVILLIRHLFTRDFNNAWRLCNIALGVLAAWGILAVLASSMRCSARSVLAKNADMLCPNQASRWKLIIILETLTELGIVLLPSILLLRLRMGMSSKVLVIIAFSFRLPNVVFSCIFLSTHLTHLNRCAAADGNPSLSIAVSSAWLESTLAYSLISATIPCLKTFMRKFQTGGTSFTGPLDGNRDRSGYSNSYSHGYSNGTDFTTGNGGLIESHTLKSIVRSVTSKTHLRRDDSGEISDSLPEDGSIIEHN